jgi:phage terminase large subunit
VTTIDLTGGAPQRLRHYYEPRGACRRLFDCRDPEVLISGPAGTGKSRACLEKLLMLALANPGMRGLIIRKTAVSMTSTALVTWREFVVREALSTGMCTYYGGSSVEPAQFRFRNGSRVMVGGMDRATKIMSSEYDVVFVQEAIELSEDDWEALSTRLRHGAISFQQLMADTNPDTDIHWLNQRCNSGATTRLESRHTDNPILYAAGGQPTERGAVYMARLDSLTGVRRLRLRDGLWVAAEGIIYEDWNPALHLIDRFPIPQEWPRWWAVDFGYTNPFVLQWWAEDPDGRLILYRELYRTKRLVEDHAADALACVAPDGEWIEPRPMGIICDHDAEGRATLERHLKLSTVPANKKVVTEGIQAVASRMKPQGPDGRPRIELMRDSVERRDPDLIEAKKPTCTAEEVPGYIWAPPTAGRKAKEEPQKEDDHGCDGMRYVVSHRDLRGRSRVRVL